ncbi:hypothetical protein V1264_017344 [Littorina saxatilis]|uniref:Uncharacterized protein n=1 Tax=Littorina saxatilis TaxID=31220 RepID=A0AAN9BIZ3_9CAEN
MPVENIAFRAICGGFCAVFLNFMCKRAKVTAAMINSFTRKSSTARVQCVLLTVILLHVLMCANDIERNPGPVHSIQEGIEERLHKMILSTNEQHASRLEGTIFRHFDERFADFSTRLVGRMEDSLRAVTEQIGLIQSRMDFLENSQREMEDRLEHFRGSVDDELDKLEAFSRRDNLKFFNVPQTDTSGKESYDECATALINVLHNTVPDKQWSRDDIVRAHRLHTNRSGPQPMIAKLAKWSDKMDILTKGRDKLNEKGVRVACDLTSRQQNMIRQHRDRGIHAYYRGNTLVVDGPLQSRRNHRHQNDQEHHSSYAAAAQNDRYMNEYSDAANYDRYSRAVNHDWHNEATHYDRHQSRYRDAARQDSRLHGWYQHRDTHPHPRRNDAPSGLLDPGEFPSLPRSKPQPTPKSPPPSKSPPTSKSPPISKSPPPPPSKIPSAPSLTGTDSEAECQRDRPPHGDDKPASEDSRVSARSDVTTEEPSPAQDALPQSPVADLGASPQEDAIKPVIDDDTTTASLPLSTVIQGNPTRVERDVVFHDALEPSNAENPVQGVMTDRPRTRSRAVVDCGRQLTLTESLSRGNDTATKSNE